MAKSDVEEVTSNTIREGGLLAKVYFDMQSEKKEDLQPLMANMINEGLLKMPGVVYCFGSINEPIPVDNVFSTSATLTMLFKDLGALINLAMQYSPAAIEVMRPEKEYVLKAPVLHSILTDISNASLEYHKFILSRAMKPEDYAKLQEDLKRREELGKKLLGKKEDEKQ